MSRLQARTYPNGVALVGGSPAVTSQGFQSGSSLAFTVTVPTTANAGAFGITALATTSAGTLVESAELTLDVERADAPQSLTAQPSGIQFSFVGDSLSVDVVGVFADGSKWLMTQSSQLQVSSSNTGVALFQNGSIIAAGAGSTSVTFAVGSITQSVRVTVPTSIRGDLNADGRVDQSDVSILNSALNTPATISGDARDLNQDGQTTTADRTILQSLCTVQKPLCATH
jgi:hypothetical protein